MYKMGLTYEDFDGNERTEDFYFNLTKAEVTELETSMNGGLSNLLEKIVNEKDNEKIISYFKMLVLKAYGQKSLDGRIFMKNDQLRDEFACTAAYSEIFMKLATDADIAAEFVNGILPKSLAPEDHKKAEANDKNKNS